MDRSNIRNHILRSLSPEDFASIAGRLERVPLPLKLVLHRRDETMDHVYFVESGIVSLITRLEDGHSTEIGLTGSEGVVDLPAALGDRLALAEALIQVAGEGWRLPPAALRALVGRSPAALSLLLRCIQAGFAQVSQTAACNSQHAIEQRLARWLLMARDRIDVDQLFITQEFLSTMLGVRRPGINLAIGTLEQLGAIRRGHNIVDFVDRNLLEQVCCECYAVVRREHDRMLAQPAMAG